MAGNFQKRSVWQRIRYSIRTRYSLATGFFLLAILSLFYIGGRIVLIHLVKDAEAQVKEIGTDINRLALRNADRVKRHAESLSAADTVLPIEKYLGAFKDVTVTLALRLTPRGAFVEGCMTGSNTTSRLKTGDVAGYVNSFAAWARLFASENPMVSGTVPAGILHVRGQSQYVSAVPCADGRILLLGTRFDSSAFTAQVNDSFAGMEMRVTNRKREIAAVPLSIDFVKVDKGSESKRIPFGIAPLVSEALEFYSGGFWKLGDNPFEAVYTIRDVAGNPVSMLAVSLPQTFSNAVGNAIGRLTLFVSVVGLLLVIPIFWFQSMMLLNPLTKMTECVRAALEHSGTAECPRLEWCGDDEFAELAFSVNALVETISRRTMAIAQVENRQKALIKGLPDGLLMFDRQHRLVSLIKQPDEGDPIEGLHEGMPVDVTVYGRSGVDAMGRALDDLFENGGVKILRVDTGTGRHARHFDVRLSRTDAHFALAIVRDITASVMEHARRMAAETRLSHTRKQESLTLLAGSIAHDMNNVLATVNNTMEIAWMDEQDPFIRDAVTTIRDAVRRGSAMMRELMTFAGETKILLKPCDPSSLVRETQRLAKGVLSERVTVTYHLADGLPAVDADPDQIWKVFFNLMKNAGEAMNDVGSITVSTQAFVMTEELAEEFISSAPIPPGPGVLFRIDDTGPGIKPEMLRRIFDPYVSTKSSGRGLGLAIVASIVEAHHGGIRVESVLGCGSSFRVFLPALKTPPVSPSTAETTASEPAWLTTARDVLLVDDDQTLLKTTQILLKVLKYTVHTATEHREAMDIFRRIGPNLACVIMDASLGETDPVRLMASFRSVLPSVPVIVSSGYPPEKIQEIFASQPYNAFLPKPYSLFELKAALAGLA